MKIALDIREDEGVDLLCKRVTCATAVVAAEKAMFGTQLSKVMDENIDNHENDNRGKNFELFPWILEI